MKYAAIELFWAIAMGYVAWRTRQKVWLIGAALGLIFAIIITIQEQTQ